MIKKLLYTLGVNKEILFTTYNSVLGALGSVVTSLLIINYFSIYEQGYYYTFGSILAIQVFFELGLNGIIVQFVAHEVAHLNFNDKGLLVGDLKYKSRLSSLLHFSIKWYCIFSILLFTTLIIVGLVFFNKFDKNSESVKWIIPWIVLVMGSGLNLLISPITAFLQGLGKVKEVAKFQLMTQCLRLIIIWIGLTIGAKLIILGLSNIIPALFISVLFLLKFKKELNDIWKTNIIEKISYVNEIFPLQWKIAISWISGYFISQLFNPVLFATEGPAIAGQMGLTLSALNGIMSISLAWLTTKVPVFSGLIAKKNYTELDIIFNKTIKQSALINIFLITFFIFVVIVLKTYHITLNSKYVGDRFLDYWPLIFMSIPVFINQVVAGWAIYLRCHKKEPYLIFSLVGGLACVFSILFFGKKFGIIGLSLSYFLIILLMSPWAYFIYKKKKISWHQ